MTKAGNMDGVLDMLGEMGDMLHFLHSENSKHEQNSMPAITTSMVNDLHNEEQSEIM